jgi:hypothetical protein
VRLGKGISHAVAVNGEKGLLVTVTDNGGLLQIHTAVRNLLRPADEAVVEKVKVYRLAAVGTRVGGPECIRPQRSSQANDLPAGCLSESLHGGGLTHESALASIHRLAFISRGSPAVVLPVSQRVNYRHYAKRVG